MCCIIISYRNILSTPPVFACRILVFQGITLFDFLQNINLNWPQEPVRSFHLVIESHCAVKCNDSALVNKMFKCSQRYSFNVAQIHATRSEFSHSCVMLILAPIHPNNYKLMVIQYRCASLLPPLILLRFRFCYLKTKQYDY